MGKTYRMTSGRNWDPESGWVPWSKTVEIEEDPEKEVLSRIRKSFKDLCRGVRESSYCYYTVVGNSAVDANLLKGAEAARGLIARKLNIPWPMEIVWIDDESQLEKKYVSEYGCRDWEFLKMDEPIWGKTTKWSDKIWILKGRDLWGTLRTVAHELAHITQSQDLLPEEMEADACQVADQMVAELYASLR